VFPFDERQIVRELPAIVVLSDRKDRDAAKSAAADNPNLGAGHVPEVAGLQVVEARPGLVGVVDP
jgi:hypothetical protein